MQSCTFQGHESNNAMMLTLYSYSYHTEAECFNFKFGCFLLKVSSEDLNEITIWKA